jgi:hypothetical protein
LPYTTRNTSRLLKAPTIAVRTVMSCLVAAAGATWIPVSTPAIAADRIPDFADKLPAQVWPYHGLIVGFDRVACDSVGLRIIEAKRRASFGEERPLAPTAKHIALADMRRHLGTADPAKIEIIRIGYDQDSLI